MILQSGTTRIAKCDRLWILFSYPLLVFVRGTYVSSNPTAAQGLSRGLGGFIFFLVVVVKGVAFNAKFEFLMKLKVRNICVSLEFRAQ